MLWHPPERSASLDALLASDEPLLVPGVADALTARMVERTGFRTCYVTGAGFANASFALPDIGLVSRNELVEHTRRVTAAVSIPVIVDADTGFGGPAAVAHTVRLLEQAGAAAIQIEDQVMPKRCGHFGGIDVVPLQEMRAKISAALSGRSNPSTLIIARTDAIGPLGFDEALYRAQEYADAGADILFVEAPVSVDQLKRIPPALPGKPALINVVEGGRTPHLTTAEYAAMGFRVVLHANLLLRGQIRAAQQALNHLHATAESVTYTDQLVSWTDRQDLVGLAAFDAFEDAMRDAPGMEGDVNAIEVD